MLAVSGALRPRLAQLFSVCFPNCTFPFSIALRPPARPHDRKIDEAKAALLERFFASERTVYYGRQLEIFLEREFFHWITKRALNELSQEGQIGFIAETIGSANCHFYFPRTHRYPRRQIKEMLTLIGEFSDPTFTRALGAHGELLVESSFSRIGFRVLGHSIQRVGSRRWETSEHDLDFLVERDGIQYGVEVKNQLGYIDRDELRTKLAMCAYLEIRPMFCVRRMPANYLSEVVSSGDYVQMAENQNYPLLAEDLAQRVRLGLKLPVAVIRRLPDTALQRFASWHERSL